MAEKILPSELSVPARLMMCACVLALGFLCFPARSMAITPADKAILLRADRLIKSHKPGDAYELLSPLQEKLAGQQDYDYLLGLSELDSGRAELATIALERVLLVDPKFAGARMALARAYFAMGDYTSAKAEFNKVLGYNPPPQVRVAVNQYLAAIKQKTETRTTYVHGYLSTRFGRDTDLNAGPNVSTFDVPALNNLQVSLLPTSQRTGDDYGELAGGISVEHRVKGDMKVYLNINGSQKNFLNQHPFNQTGANGDMGLVLGSGKNVYRIGGSGGQNLLGSSSYYYTYGINAAWQHVADRHNLWTLFGQENTIRYNQVALSSYDIDQFLGGISETHALGNNGKVSFVTTLYGGYEHDIHHRADGAKWLWGGNLGVQANLTRYVSMYGAGSAQIQNYQRENAAFLTTRHDKLYSAVFGIALALAKKTTLQTEVDYMDNVSNIVLYQYKRTDLSFTLRQDFN